MGTKVRMSFFQCIRRMLLFIWLLALPLSLIALSPAAIVMAGLNQTVTLGIIFLVIWSVSSLIFGRMYCAIGCPWGAGQEIMATLIPKRLSERSRKVRRIIRYVFFGVWFGIILFSIIKHGGFKKIDLFFPQPVESTARMVAITTPSSLIPYFLISITLFIVLTLVIGNRAACNYFCPMNVLGIIGTKVKNLLRYPSLHLECTSKVCVGCKRCNSVCPMSINVEELVKKGDMYDEDCIMCGSCIETCNKKVVRYAWKW